MDYGMRPLGPQGEGGWSEAARLSLGGSMDGNESLLTARQPSPSDSDLSLGSLDLPSADGSTSTYRRELDLDSNHLTGSLGTLRGASAMQTLVNYCAATAGHCLLDVTQTAGKCSVSGIAVLCTAVPFAVDRSAGMLLEITEVTRCSSYSDVAHTIGGWPARAIIDWSTVLFSLVQVAECARLLYVLLPSVLAILASVEATRSGPMMRLGTGFMLAATTLLLWPMMRVRSLRALRAASGGCVVALGVFVASIVLHAASLGQGKLKLALALSPKDVESNIEFLRLALLWCTALQGHSVLPTLFAELRRASARDARELELKLRHSRFVSKRTKMRWLVRVGLLGCGCAFALLALSARLAFPAGSALNVLQDISGRGATSSDKYISSLSSLSSGILFDLVVGCPPPDLSHSQYYSGVGVLWDGAAAALAAAGCGSLCCRGSAPSRRLADRRLAGRWPRAYEMAMGAASLQPTAHPAVVTALLAGSAAVGLALPLNVLAAVYEIVSGVSSALLLFVMPAALLLSLRGWQRQNTPARSGAAVVHGTRYHRASSMLRALEVWAVLLCGILLVVLSVLVPVYELGWLDQLVAPLQLRARVSK
ncbi:hypothetical protein T492DRAFT_1012074 [Pavlovales sp. CCMP2436]|nr:hypothetical protein T492DRAFT_1012074 [Pavlovales sp. CCMP2436]